MSLLTNFYSNNSSILLKDKTQKTFTDIIESPNEYWEQCLDFIQYLFPTQTPSQYCVTAPLLTKLEAKYIREYAWRNFSLACERFQDFIQHSDMNVMNHNFLRITRYIESSVLILDRSCGLHNLGVILNMTHISYTDENAKYWAKAVLTEWE